MDVRREETILKLPLYAHQLRALEFAIEAQKCVLALDMGVGKTAVAIAVIVGCKMLNPLVRVLIVVPAALREQWSSEIVRFSNLRQGDDFVLCSYSSLKNLARCSFDIVVGDEAHYIKNPTAKRSQLFARLCKSSERVLLLSGTPAESHDHLFNLLHIVRPCIFSSHALYRSRFCIRHQMMICGRAVTTWTTNKNSAELRQLCAECVLRMDISQVDLPELHTRIIELSNDHVAEPASNWMDQWREGCFAKIPDTIRWMDEYMEQIPSGDQVCVFVFHKHTARELYRELDTRFGCVLFTGDTDRGRALTEFQSGKRTAVLTLSSSATGLNLQFANHLVFAEITPDSILMKQACGRVFRLGQQRETYITTLVGGGVDAQVVCNLDRKQLCSATILEACKPMY